MERKVVVLGSGPAGLTAALYAARAQLEPLLIRGDDLGGLIATTSSVENYPGFPDGIAGFSLFERMELQAERYGTAFLDATVTTVDLSQRPFRVTTDAGEVLASSLIVATGAAPRKLGVPGEARLSDRGVSYCATCDGPSYIGKRVVVVGGGNSAIDEGLFLARYASEIVFVHRRSELRADPVLVERALDEPKVQFLWDTVVEEILGEEEVEGVRLRNLQTGAESGIEVGGIFPFIGHVPNTKVFIGQLALNERGFLVTDDRGQTSVPGVFAAGDVADARYRQAVIAAGEGARAAMEAARFLDAAGAAQQPVALASGMARGAREA